MSISENLTERYITEALIWSPLDRPTPLFHYVQDPVFNLTSTEVILLELLRHEGLRFTMRPRYDPSSFISITPTLHDAVQNVRLEVHHGQPSTADFILERTPFAEDFREWLQIHCGQDNFLPERSVITRHFARYAYLLNVDMDFVARLQQGTVSTAELHHADIYADNRNSQLFYNFSEQERHFLNSLEAAIQHQGMLQRDPLCILVMPRQTDVGSIELVLQNNASRQPARTFISGYYPLTYQVISENSPLTHQLKQCLDLAFGIANFDEQSSRFSSKYASLIYHMRYSVELLNDLDAQF